MDKFSMWTGIAHATLIKHHPKFKRSQACECLASWLGHRTYASFKSQDMTVLNGGIKHAVVDAQAAMKRAEAFGMPLTQEQWWKVERHLTPSGISGMWLTDMGTMNLAARLAFEDNFHPDAQALVQTIGMTDGRIGEKVLCHTPADQFPEQLWFTVHGAIRAYNDEAFTAIPVLAAVVFERAGRRLYQQGEVQSITQNGTPYPYEPEFDGD